MMEHTDMTSIELTAPAKVNLFLKVLGKRRDSYHNILTLFEKISLADKVKISKIPEGVVIKSNKFITRSAKENLAYKAAEIILNRKEVDPSATPIRRGLGTNFASQNLNGVKIEIEKNIPIAGGLGGGSSDAAAVLIGINRLFSLKLKKVTLTRLARRLGADVPFFLLDTPFAIGKGRGDRLKAIDSKASFWHLIIWPGLGVATKEVYGAFDASASLLSKGLTKGPADVKIRSLFKGPMDFGTLESMLHNDLQDIVISKKDVIGRVINRLASSIAKKAIVSGSGPSLFCLYRTRKEAVRARDRLLRAVPARERKFWRIFIVKTMD